jgi:hypothetical protein
MNPILVVIVAGLAILSGLGVLTVLALYVYFRIETRREKRAEARRLHPSQRYIDEGIRAIERELQR